MEGHSWSCKAAHLVLVLDLFLTLVKVYRNFQRLCKNLDAHKKVFGIFPSQNMYTQVFCGSLALIVEVSECAATRRTEEADGTRLQ